MKKRSQRGKVSGGPASVRSRHCPSHPPSPYPSPSHSSFIQTGARCTARFMGSFLWLNSSDIGKDSSDALCCVCIIAICITLYRGFEVCDLFPKMLYRRTGDIIITARSRSPTPTRASANPSGRDQGGSGVYIFETSLPGHFHFSATIEPAVLKYSNDYFATVLPTDCDTYCNTRKRRSRQAKIDSLQKLLFFFCSG